MASSSKKSRPRRKTTNPTSKAKKALFVQIFIGVFVLLITGGLLYLVHYVTNLPSLQINSVAIEGVTSVSQEVVANDVNEMLLGSYFRLIPKSFIYLHPEEDIKDNLSSYSQFKNITLSRTGQRLDVLIEEYKLHALWCGNSNDCVFLDENGYAFNTAPNLEGSAYIRYYRKGEEPSLLVHVYQPEDWQFVTEMVRVLNEKDYRFRILGIDRTAEDEFEFLLQTGAALKLTKKQTIEETLTNLTTLLNTPAFTELQFGDFSYIDLRYGDKMFIHDGTEVATTSEQE